MTKTVTPFCRHRRRRPQSPAERGQSMVEFSLLLLPFLLVTIGVIEIGRAWSVKQAITNAAREGTRILLLPYGPAQNCPGFDCSTAESVQTAAVNATRSFLVNAGVSAEAPLTQITLIRQKLQSNGTISTEPLNGPMVSGDLIGIHIRHQHVSLIRGFLASDSTTLNMVGVSVMRHE